MNTFINLARFSLSVVSNPTLSGGVTLTAGTNVTLAQSGQNITISASGGGSVTYPLLAPDGTSIAPSYAFASDPGAGLYWDEIDGALTCSGNVSNFVIGQTGGSLWIGPISVATSVQVADDGAGALAFFVNNGIEALAINEVTGALSLWDGSTLQPVTFGAADSGGTGFRVLRIPN